jgi:hypothetical protein
MGTQFTSANKGVSPCIQEGVLRYNAAATHPQLGRQDLGSLGVDEQARTVMESRHAALDTTDWISGTYLQVCSLPALPYHVRAAPDGGPQPACVFAGTNGG